MPQGACGRDAYMHRYAIATVDLIDSMLRHGMVDAFVGASTGVSGPFPAAVASVR